MIYEPQGIYETGEDSGGGQTPGQEFTVIGRGQVFLIDGTAELTRAGLTTNSLIYLTPQGAPTGVIYEDKAARNYDDPGNERFTISSTDITDAISVAYLVINPS